MKKLSPLAPGGFPDMPPVPGVSLAAACCGLRYAGRVRMNDTAVAGRLRESTGA